MKQAMEVLVWQGNGFACMGMRKAGQRNEVAATKYPTIEAAKADLEKKLSAHSITPRWEQSDKLCDNYSFGGWIGHFER